MITAKDFVQMPIEERARRLVGDMPWVTENLKPSEIEDLVAQIETSMRCVAVQAEISCGRARK